MSVFMGMANAYRASQASAAASSAQRAAGEAQREAETVEAQLDRAMLVCEAMWSLMRDKLGVTETELLDRIVEIDLSDGQLDGKVKRPPVSCPKCQRTIARRFNRCMYCGQPVMHDPFA